MRRLCTIDKGLPHAAFPLLLTLLSSSTAFSQDDLNAAMRESRREYLSSLNENANSRMLREVREAFVKEHMDASLSSFDATKADPAVADQNFISRVPQFRNVVAQYRTAMSLEQSSAKPLKEMDRFVEAFKTYFEQTHVNATPVDAVEFRNFSPTELLWETLTTAERVDTKLRQAAILVHNSRLSNVTTVQSMLFLQNLHSELRRLDLLISKLK